MDKLPSLLAGTYIRVCSTDSEVGLWTNYLVYWQALILGSAVTDSEVGLWTHYLVYWQAWLVVEQEYFPIIMGSGTG